MLEVTTKWTQNPMYESHCLPMAWNLIRITLDNATNKGSGTSTGRFTSKVLFRNAPAFKA